jgi:hypothetical protein
MQFFLGFFVATESNSFPIGRIEYFVIDRKISRPVGFSKYVGYVYMFQHNAGQHFEAIEFKFVNSFKRIGWAISLSVEGSQSITGSIGTPASSSPFCQS